VPDERPPLRSFLATDEPPPPLPRSGALYLMGLNESPYPPTPAVVEAVMTACQEGHRYPSLGNDELVTVLADRLNLPRDMIVVGPGLVSLCRALVHATAGPGDEVIFPWPSFDDYLVDAMLHNATPIRSPLARHCVDLDDIQGRIGPHTRLVFLCNPNNPTGTAFGHAELERFLDGVPPSVLVVLDEAYREFGGDGPADGLRALPDRRNLCVLRTFSKAYGLAGFRVAYGMAHPCITEALRNVLPAFGLSRIAEIAAVAALHDQAEVDRRVDQIIAERDRLNVELRAAGWPTVASHANFVWLPVGAQAEAVADRIAGAEIAVRAYPRQGIRITATTAADRHRLLDLLKDGPPAPGDRKVGS
jgi:histidinol-phosphate aminotransferase